MSIDEKVEQYKKTDFKCGECGSKLGLIPQTPSPRLDYECPNCRRHIFYDKGEGKWYLTRKKEIPEPEIWE